MKDKKKPQGFQPGNKLGKKEKTKDVRYSFRISSEDLEEFKQEAARLEITVTALLIIGARKLIGKA